MTTPTMTPWTYDGYRNTVLGVGNAPAIVREFDLAGATERDLDEWLGNAEAEAWAAGSPDGPLPEEWAEFHRRALEALVEAAAIYVVWGEGHCYADVDNDPTLLAYTPWAGQELVGEQWVGSWLGEPSDLNSEAAVIGYRQLAEHELREWRGR